MSVDIALSPTQSFYWSLRMKKSVSFVILGCIFAFYLLPGILTLIHGDLENVTVSLKNCADKKCEYVGNLHTDPFTLGQTLITKNGERTKIYDGNWYWMKWKSD